LAITPKEFNKLIPYTQQYDCVIASRWLPKSHVQCKEPLIVRFASRCLNIIVRTLFGIKIKDSQCGAKVFKTKLVQKVVPKCVVTDMTFDVELLWRIKKAGGTIKEVPIVWSHQKEHGKTRVIRNSYLMLKGMARMVRSQ